MKRPSPLLFELQDMVVNLAKVDRNHYLPASERHENDIEHSFAVAMLCWYICDSCKINLDITKILKYSLVHDFAERYAGDINTYASKEARAKKVVLEKLATDRLSKEFKDFSDLVMCMQAYEAKQDDEALFVWSVDKMQALVLADLDGWRPYQKIGITYENFIAKHSEQLALASPYCKDIFKTLFEYCQTTFYDRP